MNKKSKKIILIFLSCFTAIFLSGCWDYMEIQRRGYVLGLGIDTSEQKDIQKNKIEAMQTEESVPKYIYTMQVPIIAKATIKPGVQGGSGGNGSKKVWNLRVAGNSFFEANREYSTRIDYPPFYEHLKVIVINEGVARGGIYAPLDFIFRDPEMRRRTKVFVTPGEAYNILDITPNIEDYPSMYLRSLPNNARKNSRILHKTDIGSISEAFHSGKDFMLPKVEANKTEIKDAGAAVFKKDKMVGWIDEIQTNYAKWVSNTVLGGTLTVESPDDPKSQVSLEIKSLKTDVKPVVNGEQITFDISTKGIFHIAEINHPHDKRAEEQDFIREVERIAEKKAEKQMREVIEYVQGEYGADVFFFHKAMQRYAPDTWDKVEKDWDNIFPKVKTNIKVNIKIEQVGLIK